ncbi:MAG: NADH-quinone oxidoreductase subunit N [Acidimicrobiia bacterium]
MKIGDVSFYGLFPVILFTFSLCALTIFRSLVRNNHRLHLIIGSISTVFVSFIVLTSQAVRWRQFDTGKLTNNDMSTLNDIIKTDRTSAICIFVLCLIVGLVAIISFDYLKSRPDIPGAEFYILLQAVVVGMFAMVMANDFIAMFVALEVFSIPLYVLTAFDRRRVRSLEGGFKYFIMGAVSSAIFLYGIALHYGLSGTTALDSLVENSTLAAVSTVFILVGLLFKVAAVPFHFWSPDAYQGAPTPITTFMSAGTKLVAFVALARIIQSSAVDSTSYGEAVRIILTLTTLASAFVGSFILLKQTNIKRALAYSSIAHSSYILLALKSATDVSYRAVIAYVIIYSFVIIGAFAIVGVVCGANEQNDSIESFKGLGKTNPVLAAAMTILLLSQAGIPLTSGFIAKLQVFQSAFEGGLYITAVALLIATVISAAFYLKLVLAIYDGDSSEGSKLVVPDLTTVAIGVCIASVVLIGIFPSIVTGLTSVL